MGPGSEGQAKARRRSDLGALALIVLFTCVLFGPVLAGGGSNLLGTLSGDGRSQFLCWRVYGFSRLAEGGFPLWNPYVFLGMPFVGNIQSAMFYPTNYLMLLMPPDQAINLGIVLNLLLGGLFAYLLARRLDIGPVGATVTALVFMYGGPQFLRIYEGHWVHLCAITWIPLLILATEMVIRRGKLAWALVGGIAVAMQMFGGHPQYLFYSAIAALIYFALRMCISPPYPGGLLPSLKRLFLFGFMFAAAIGLCAAQLFPSLELLSLSARRARLSYEWISQYSFAPENLLTTFVPTLFGDGRAVLYWGRNNIWEMSLYISAAGVALVLLSLRRLRERRVVICGLCALALIVLALGRHTLLLRALYHTTPGFDLFRCVARFMAPALLFLGLLAGFGTQRLLSRVPGKGAKAFPVTLIVFPAALLTASAAGYGWGGVPSWWDGLLRWLLSFKERIPAYFDPAEFTLPVRQAAYFMAWNGLFIAAALCMGLAIVVFASSLLKPHVGRVLLVIGLLMLLCGDVYCHSSRYLVTYDAEEWSWDEEVLDFFDSQSQPFRVSSPSTWAIGSSDPMVYRVASLEGIEPNVPYRFNDLFWFTQQRSTEEMRTSYQIGRASPLFDLLNLQYVVRSNTEKMMMLPNEETRVSTPRFVVKERIGAMPRAFMVHAYDILTDESKVLERLASLDFRKTALLEKRPSIEPREPAEPSSVFVESYLPERVVLKVSAAAPGLLVLSDMYYPGWTAELDGSPAEILCADYVLRAVAVQEGEHTVEFRYEPFSFKLGLWVSVLSWGGLVTYFIVLLAKRKRTANVSSI